mgnify:FL=1
MLLLGIAGVEKKDIISNYEVTYSNLESFHKPGFLTKGIPEVLLLSKREYLEHAYDYLMEKYGGFESYLFDKGISEDVIQRVKGRLLHTEDELEKINGELYQKNNQP